MKIIFEHHVTPSGFIYHLISMMVSGGSSIMALMATALVTACLAYARNLYTRNKPFKMPEFMSSTTLKTILAIVGFLALAVYYQTTHPHDRFFYGGARECLLTAHFTRLAMCFYVVLIWFGYGQLSLKLFCRRQPLNLSGAEELIVASLAGAALLRMIIFFNGILGSFHAYSMILLGLVGIAFACPRALQIARDLAHDMVSGWSRASGDIDRFAKVGLVTALLISIFTVLMRKMIAPDGGGDFITHYLPYYLEVMKSGNLMPNDVWYHFYISKGVGDVFFIMGLTDAIGPGIVSGAMFIIILALIYAFTKRLTDDRVVAVFASTMTATALIWTPGENVFDTWADFSKQHILTAAMYFGFLWSLWLLWVLPIEKQRPTFILTLISLAGLTVFRTQFTFMCGLLIFFVFVAALISRRRNTLGKMIALGFVTLSITIGLTYYNYVTTGLGDVTPFRFFRQFFDQDSFARWYSPFLMLELELGSSPNLGGVGASLGAYPFSVVMQTMLRFGYLKYFLGLVGTIGIVSSIAMATSPIKISQKRVHMPVHLVSGLLMLVAITLVNLITLYTLNQPVSMYRFFVFALFPVMIFGSVIFVFLRQATNAHSLRRQLITLIMLIIVLSAFTRITSDIPRTNLEIETAYASGQISTADLYASRGQLWRPGVDICKAIPPGSRVWLSRVKGEHFMSPRCYFETFFSFAMGNNWHEIAFGKPEMAVAELKKLDLNYFVIDTNEPFFDILPYSALFLPKNIDKYFGVVWSNKGVYLITWASDKTKPFPPEFNGSYKESIKKAHDFADFDKIHYQLQLIYNQWLKNGKTWPVATDPSMPHPRGWQ